MKLFCIMAALYLIQQQQQQQLLKQFEN